MIHSTSRAAWHEHRSRLKSRPDCRFLDLEGWRRLLTSVRVLRRRDLVEARLKGVEDPHTGEIFVIEEEQLAGV